MSTDRRQRRVTSEPRVTKWVVRVLTLLSLAIYGFVFSFVVGTDAGWRPGEHVHLVGALVMGLVFLVGMGRLLIQPADRAALWQSCAALLAVLLVQVIVGDPDNHGGQAGPYDLLYLIVASPFVIAVLLALRLPAAGERRRSGLVRFFFVLGGLGLFLMLPYVVDQGLTQRNSWPPAADPHHNSHWATMAQVVLVVPLLAMLSALPINRWRMPALTASASALLLGVTSTLYSHEPSSLGLIGGLAAVAWGAGVGVLASRSSDPAVNRFTSHGRTVSVGAAAGEPGDAAAG
jgi:hypothetical protein